MFEDGAVEGLQGGLRGGDGEAGLEASEGLDPAGAAVGEGIPTWGEQRLHEDGYADLRGAGGIKADEAGGRDADDRHGIAVDGDFGADDLRVGGEAGDPIVVAEDDDGVALVDLVVFLGIEDAARGGLHTEGSEEIAGNEFGVDAFGFVAGRDGEGGGEAAEDFREGLRLFAAVLAVGIGTGVGAAVVAHVWAGRGDEDELFGVLDGQQAKHELIEEGEDGGISADAEGEREYGNNCKDGGAAERAEGVAKVTDNTGHTLGCTGVPRKGSGKTWASTLILSRSCFVTLCFSGSG